jgi:small subunit ribosomal protein S16
MALKIRLQRKGTRHSPVYRMVVTESKFTRDGRFVEILGTYAPQARGQDKEFVLKLDRIDEWLEKGAKPSDTAADLIRKARREAAAQPAEVESAPAEAEKAEAATPAEA